MSSVSSTGAAMSTSVNTRGKATDLREVDMDQFLQLLIVELQHQDPLSPMDNAEILAQIGQIRQISATNQLSDTLAAVLAGQQMSTAATLIGRQINALSDDYQNVEGIVDRVSMEVDDNQSGQRLLRVHVGDAKIRLENIREIVG